ncbi:hypothetical protein EV644_106164 [Kribbella orskensis]|uniref:Uncharacterized protein n=1 Tax=Kribbella orskensis TaxID=2512216 RepID=A0ABY2BKL2_9ACTN|nr:MULTISPECIES: hypothetical protein [Kribbella]TCN40236.1 hypothetical protein EV642_105164 [Kribbella sp. VKM Ac-2500]TCO22856.1 hypothetical protein EV644_106164 [Kribbella orskensis]
MPTLLYKGAIRDLRGDDLLPLSMIRDRYPDLYHREAAKYAERPHVMDHPVHPLDCRWTDVVFFSPVHPAPIFDALRESGRVLRRLGYWTIDAELLVPERTCILLKRHEPLFRPQAAEDYLPYSAEAAAALSQPSDQALHRLRNLNPTEPLLPWADIPHILHRGPVPVSAFRDPDGNPVR